MAPLAGKPPFATDEPDSYYETPRAPQPRLRQPKPADPNQRTSAYDMYDSYLKEDGSKLAVPAAPSTNRNSGIGNLLMSMDDDDSDDDSDDDGGSYRHRPAAPPGISTPLSKNAALAAATGVTSAPGTPTRPSPPPQYNVQVNSPRSQGAPAPQQMQQNYPQQQQQQQRQQPFPVPAPNQQQPPHQMQPIAAPRPGYAAPIAALNLARPEPAVAPAGRQGPGMPMPMHKGPPAPIQIPSNNNHHNNNMFGGFPMPASPAPSAPHPLQPPVTPITPAFIRPSKSPAPGGVVNVSFAGLNDEGKATPRKPIMRGNSEETLLPSRGEKGDDFWRRFSMVVKEESKKGNAKESSWLHKTTSGTRAYSRWVWIIGVILLICIAGGAGIGVYLTRNSPSHQQPTAIGGSADMLATSTSSAAIGKDGKTSSSSLHVSPTLTVARRAEEPVVTPAPRAVPSQVLRRHKDLRNRDMSSW